MLHARLITCTGATKASASRWSFSSRLGGAKVTAPKAASDIGQDRPERWRAAPRARADAMSRISMATRCGTPVIPESQSQSG